MHAIDSSSHLRALQLVNPARSLPSQVSVTVSTGPGNVPGSKGAAIADIVLRTADGGQLTTLMQNYLVRVNQTLPGGLAPAAFVTAASVPGIAVVTLSRFDKSVRLSGRIFCPFNVTARKALAALRRSHGIFLLAQINLGGELPWAKDTLIRRPWLCARLSVQVPPPGSISPPMPPPDMPPPGAFALAADAIKISTSSFIQIAFGTLGGLVILAAALYTFRMRCGERRLSLVT